jgi:acyl-CoA reductase-like NAD-dependent aldehyde dehydrogenase
LELGGKDPAYVLGDADVEFAASNLVDGAFYNAGQSCCGVERIYVEDTLFDAFVEAYVEGVRTLRPGSPLDPETTLGPLARPASVAWIEGQLAEAASMGARALLTPESFPGVVFEGSLVMPQVLVDVNHQMSLMQEETFGPVVGIQRVGSDEEALRLVNDSRFGLTASIWTPDIERAERLGQAIHTGTVFANRCDYLDPELSWVGVKESGRGCTLSTVGYEHLTRPKSFHMRLVPTELSS